MSEWIGFSQSQLQSLKRLGVRHGSLTPAANVRISIDSLIGHIHIITAGGLFYLRDRLDTDTHIQSGNKHIIDSGFEDDRQTVTVFGHESQESDRDYERIFGHGMKNNQRHLYYNSVLNYFSLAGDTNSNGVINSNRQGYGLQDSRLTQTVFDTELNPLRSLLFTKEDVTTEHHIGTGVHVFKSYDAFNFQFEQVSEYDERTFAVVNYLSRDMVNPIEKAYGSCACILEIVEGQITNAKTFDMANHYPFPVVPSNFGALGMLLAYDHSARYLTYDHRIYANNLYDSTFFKSMACTEDSIYVGGVAFGNIEMALKDENLYKVTEVIEDFKKDTLNDLLPRSKITAIDSAGDTVTIEGAELRISFNEALRRIAVTQVDPSSNALGYGFYYSTQRITTTGSKCLGVVIKMDKNLQVEEARGMYATEIIYDETNPTHPFYNKKQKLNVYYGLSVGLHVVDGSIFSIMVSGYDKTLDFLGEDGKDNSNFTCVALWSEDLLALSRYKILGIGQLVKARGSVVFDGHLYLAGSVVLDDGLIRPFIMKLDRELNVTDCVTYIPEPTTTSADRLKGGFETIKIVGDKLMAFGVHITDEDRHDGLVMQVKLEDLSIVSTSLSGNGGASFVFSNGELVDDDLIVVGTGANDDPELTAASIANFPDFDLSGSGAVQNLDGVNVSPSRFKATPFTPTESTTGLGSLYLTDEMQKYGKTETFTRTETNYSTVGGNY